jgi:hypothetical protein
MMEQCNSPHGVGGREREEEGTRDKIYPSKSTPPETYSLHIGPDLLKVHSAVYYAFMIHSSPTVDYAFNTGGFCNSLLYKNPLKW